MACDKQYSKSQKKCRVKFILSAEAADGAKEVWLAGDFNSWSKCMKNNSENKNDKE